ncbi:MAG: sigma-70 family RNA polymerase sigma factor [Patescibacteria group bacterium]|nr:sigma-70 family RNA polymerase sigma factor [Patescibacteria group bacterium]
MSGNNGNNRRYVDINKQTFNKYRSEIGKIERISVEDERKINTEMRTAFNRLIEIIIKSEKNEFRRIKTYLEKNRLKDREKKNICYCGIVPRQKTVKVIENKLNQIFENNQDEEAVSVCVNCQEYIAQIKKAVNVMVASNLRLVNSIAWETKAKYYISGSLDIIDLIQIGNIGLIKAIYPFYYKLGRLSTYVDWEIKQTMQREIRAGNVIELPYKMWELQRRCRIALLWAEKEGKKIKTMEEAALSLGLSKEKAEMIQDIPLPPKSLKYKIGDEKKDELESIVADLSIVPFETIIADNEITQKIRMLISDNILSLREEKIIRLRFGINEESENTMEEIGERFSISRERIRQIEVKAIIKLRKAAKKQGMRKLL